MANLLSLLCGKQFSLISHVSADVEGEILSLSDDAQRCDAHEGEAGYHQDMFESLGLQT